MTTAYCPSTGKISYTTTAEATRAMRGQSVRRGGLSPYRCWHCSAWHLGHRVDAKRTKFGDRPRSYR